MNGFSNKLPLLFSCLFIDFEYDIKKYANCLLKIVEKSAGFGLANSCKLAIFFAFCLLKSGRFKFGKYLRSFLCFSLKIIELNISFSDLISAKI